MAETGLRVLVIGDSNSFGWPEQLEKACGGLSVTHIGEKSRTIPWVKEKLEQVRPGKYDELIIYVGVNDIHNGKRLPELEAGIREIQKLSVEKGFGRVSFVEVPPWGEYSGWTQEAGRRTVEFNEMLGRVAEESGGTARAVKVYGALEGKPGKMRNGLTAFDNLHLNARGQEAVAKKIAESIFPLRVWDGVKNGAYEPLMAYLGRIEKIEMPEPERKRALARR